MPTSTNCKRLTSAAPCKSSTLLLGPKYEMAIATGRGDPILNTMHFLQFALNILLCIKGFSLIPYIK